MAEISREKFCQTKTQCILGIRTLDVVSLIERARFLPNNFFPKFEKEQEESFVAKGK